MIESFIIASRETLEASLVVGIVLSYLSRTGQKEHNSSVYYGIGAGIVLSIIGAILFVTLAGGFVGRSEEIFEGATMFIAAALLTTMILWMMRQKHIAKEIEQKVERHIASKELGRWGAYGIFFLILFAILREGIETIIFMSAISYSSGISLIGAIIGIVVAIVVGYLFFIGSRKISLKHFFDLSSILLILFAAGLVAHGVHEFEEAGIIPMTIEHLWDTNHLIDEESTFGSFLEGLFGYNGNPSLLEVIAYAAYLCLIFFIYRKMKAAGKPHKD